MKALSDQLNVKIDPDSAFVSEKLPFAYNYVDKDYYVTHAEDSQSEHGSHVSGIVGANAYIPEEDGTFSKALDSVKVQGVAPDAQIITMKVFGKSGGAYDSDYMAAIEDAIVLGCDSVNLSLGSGSPGTSRHSSEEFQAILDDLTESGVVVSISAGNNGGWVDNAKNLGYLYADDVSMQTNGSPGSYTNSLCVASVDNDGVTGVFVGVNDVQAIYTESKYSNEPMTTLAGEKEYIFIDSNGTAEDWAAIGDVLEGKIALCPRGGMPFSEKANNAVAAGAIATIICNNQAGTINMDLSNYTEKAPVISITQADANAIRENSKPVTDESGKVLYYTGTMTVSSGAGSTQFNSEFYTMSDFSSWGVPGTLEMKPEITAPGGSIYSVFGTTPEGGGSDQYENMSGTSMAAPQISGMAALLAQHMEKYDLAAKTGLTPRQLAQSLLMSTAEPIVCGETGTYYPVIQQGAGLGNVGNAIHADSYITMEQNATKSLADGKVKVELGDDPDRVGVYNFSFNVNNMEAANKSFTLSADFFTQDLFEDYANENQDANQTAFYMDTNTISLPVNVTWEVNGKVLEPSDLVAGMDFDGNGTVNSVDGQILLDYVVGNAKFIQNQDKADIDKDGDVDTYDAYLFFKELGTSTIEVPADGSVKADVKVELTDAWDEYMDIATNGVYVEGYVFAKSMATKEGVEGTVHSIPVLGFCGNWSDPSMYEVGSFGEYASGAEYRTPYLGEITSNTYLVTYANKPKHLYPLGGNPMVPDETYMPERNAINSVNGDTVSRVQFTAIRNAAACRFIAKNLTKGTDLADTISGGVGAAYFYPAAGSWANPSNTIKTNLIPKDAEEGDQLLLNLALAPEYYMDAEGNIDWEALGDGTNFSLPLVVDNTAPVLKDVSMSLTGNTMTVTASDNQYVAAVALFNKTGTKVYAAAGSVKDAEPGATTQHVLDLSEVNGKTFALQVMDYAMNTTTYMVEMDLGEQQTLPEMMAYTMKSKYWFGFDKNTEYDFDAEHGLTPYSRTDNSIAAATIADHVVLAATENGKLYAMPESDLAEENLVGDVDMLITDMAYNKADGKVYGVSEGKLYAIDKLTAKTTEVGTIGVNTNTLACDANGTFYCNELGTAKVYKFTLDTIGAPALLGAVDGGIKLTSKYIQSMEINPNNNMLCWNSYYTYTKEIMGMIIEVGYSYYIEMDSQTGEAKVYNDLWEEVCALIIPENTSGGGWADPTDQVTDVILSSNSVNMLEGASKQLSAVVQPWTATDRNVIWASEDDSVATVDQSGMLKAVGVGTTTVTATSKLDPNVSAECKVTVDILDVTAKGVLQDAEGNSKFFSWDTAKEEKWTAGKAVDTNMVSATFDPLNKTYYIQEESENLLMHKVNEDGVTVETSTTNGAEAPLWDMAYSTYFSTKEAPKVSSIYGVYFLSPMDPMNLNSDAFNIQGRCDYATAITSLGYEKYQDVDSGEMLDTEHIVVLGNNGAVIHFWVYEDGDAMSAWISSYPSNLDLPFAGYDDGERMFCSMVAGDDGALYLSYFNGESNDMYRMAYDESNEMYTAELFGNFGENVWPVILTEVTSNTANNPSNLPKATEKVTAETVTAAEMKATVEAMQNDTANKVFDFTEEAMEAKAELNSAAGVENGEKTVTVTITAKDAEGADVASNNALMNVAYDTSKLELVSVAVRGEYSSKVQEDGKVTFGYVSMKEIPAGKPVATLTFKALAAEDSTVTVETLQVNNEKGGSEELTVEFTHENTEVRDAVEATCTEPGYTGDTYCADCGKLIAKGEVIPAKGHTWGEWEVSKKASCFADGEETRTCSVCGETETRVLPAGAEHCPCKEFTDLDCTKWYHEGVDYVLANNIMIGVDQNRFSPNGKVTRAQMVTMLYRLAGTPKVSGSNHFTDVQNGKWYTDAIVWASEVGITEGITNTTFAPGKPMTREQMVTFLYRYAKWSGKDVSASADLSKFADHKDVRPFAQDAMAWAVAEGLVEGMDGRLYPANTTTRAQAATVLMRYSK